MPVNQEDPSSSNLFCAKFLCDEKLGEVISTSSFKKKLMVN